MNRNRIANSLANPTETLRPPPYPTSPVPYVLRLYSLVLPMWGPGPQLSKVVVYDNGPTTVWFGRGSVRGPTTYLRRQKCVLLGEAKNAKQQSNNKEKEQNENRKPEKKQQKMVLYLWATERAELYKSRPNSPNKNLNRTHSDNTHTHTSTQHTLTHTCIAKSQANLLKIIFVVSFARWFVYNLFSFWLMKQNEPSRVIKEQ